MSEATSQQATAEHPLRRAISSHSLRVFGRLSVSMLVVGIGLGLASLLSWVWIEATILPEQEGTEALIVEGYTPLVFLVVAAVAAPLVAGIVGFVEGQRLETRDDLLVVGIGCLIGAILLVFAAGIFIGSTGGDGGAGPGPMDLVGLAGLSGTASVLAGVLSSIAGRTNRSQQPAVSAELPDETATALPPSDRNDAK